MRRSFNWQKRAVPLFAAAVLILCFFLTAFAVREAERERLLKQKELQADQPRIADRINERFKSLIADVEIDSFGQVSSFEGSAEAKSTRKAAASIQDGHDVVDMVFFIDQTGRVDVPLETPLYEIPGERSSLESRGLSGVTDPLLRMAEAAEFRQKDYATARRLYGELLNRISDRSVQADLLGSIGRCYLKAGRPLEAVSTYRRILESYDDLYSPDETPAGLLALYQISISYSRAKEPRPALDAAVELYKALLEPRWRISREKFQTYLRQIKDLWESIVREIPEEPPREDQVDKWHRLQGSEAERIDRTQALSSVVGACLAAITENRDRGSNPGKFSRFTISSDGRVCLVSFSPLPDSSILGLAFKTDRLISDLLPDSLSADISAYPWQTSIADGSGRILAGDPIPPSREPDPELDFSRPLDPGFPDWRIRVSMLSPSPADTAFIKRRNLYILIALVVTAAVLGGGTMAIRSTAKELQLARLKSEFVSTVSHEFRTPLTSIRYLSELLERNRVPEESLKFQYYRTITRESERLSQLIENILDFSKIEAGMKKYELTKTDVKGLIEETASRFRNQVLSKKFSLTCTLDGELPSIPLDGEAIQRALLNLLDNAVKYSGQNRTVEVRAWVDPSYLHIAVEDHGVGIEPEEQNKVFEKFHRSERNSGSHIRGSGIGLTVVSHTVEGHGGRVSLDSEPGKGTTVTIHLPLVRKIVKGGLK